jgi:hypothetical protein
MEYRKPLDQTDPDAPYVDANPVYEIKGSIIPAYALEAPQREIVNAIKAVLGENTPDPDDLEQLSKAILEIKSFAADAATAAANAGADLKNATDTLAIEHGGTGRTSAPSMLTNLATTSAASPLAETPRPGVTGTLPIANGGTGATTAANALTALGGAPTSHTHTADQISGLQTSYSELITTSKTWTAPYTGKYKITLVGGGGGGCHKPNNAFVGEGGRGGETVTTIFTLTKDKACAVQVGTGGQSGGSGGSSGTNSVFTSDPLTDDTPISSITATGGIGGRKLDANDDSSLGQNGGDSLLGRGGVAGINFCYHPIGYGGGGYGGSQYFGAAAGNPGCILIEYLGA